MHAMEYILDLVKQYSAISSVYLAPITVTAGLVSLVWGIAYKNLYSRLHREKELLRTRKEYARQLEDKVDLLENDIKCIEKSTALYWLDAASGEKQYAVDDLPEYEISLLQDGLIEINDSTKTLYLRLGEQRAIQYYETCEKSYLQQAERLVRIATLMCPEDRNTASLHNEILKSLVQYELDQGIYDPDDPLLLQEKQNQSSVKFANDEDVITNMMNHGQVAFDRGHWRLAELLLNRARYLALNTIGSRTRLALIVRNNHMRVAFFLGLNSFCRREIDVLVEDCYLGLPDQDQLFLSTRYLQAEIFSDLGRYAEALDIVNDLLPVEEHVLGKDDFSSLSTRYLQAQIFRDLGRYNEALDIVNDLLPVEEHVLGKDDFISLSTRYLQAQILNRLGRYAEALDIVNDLLPLQEKTIGKEHPDNLSTRSLRAQLFRDLGRYNEALDIVNDLLPVEEQVLGKGHRNTLLTRYLQAEIISDLGRYNEALDIVNDLLPVEEHVLGKEHRYTMSTRHLQAHIFCKLGRYDEALDIVNDLGSV